MYYLNSRYYNPEFGRFINADGVVSTGQDIIGFNMFAYCGNNPVNRADTGGNCWYDAKGVWRHDNWENLYGYEKKPAPPLVDITDKLDNAMKENAKTFSDYKNKHTYIQSAVYFKEQVKPGGAWDFKSQESWAFDSTTVIYIMEHNSDMMILEIFIMDMLEELCSVPMFCFWQVV